ncbi:ATP-binding cassette domain-containing protein [Streptomyces sp. NPDC091371]|uniref:ATP-binding cassette domain-containing protein n=1 Tax=Streptomyces sp. NPDC091371 TaxID=3155303 RepID=UPI0034181021
MIELSGLTKRYGDKTAVDHLTFTVRPGAVTGFLGPNGAGKTTTMRMMLDLDRPTSGSVSIGGKRYSGLREPMKQIGALLDAKALHPARTAYHHLLWLARSNRIPGRRVGQILETVGLSDVAHQRAGAFSLGMGQRLAPESDEAVAAAALVAAQCPGGEPAHPVYGPDEPLPDLTGLRDLALQALDRIMTEPSELMDLWAEADGAPWRANIRGLQNVLQPQPPGEQPSLI